MAIVKFPTDEELHEAFIPYVCALGKVVHAWNYLHLKLGQLYVVIADGTREDLLRDWYSDKVDTNQRKRIRKAVESSPEDRWLPRLPEVRADLLWLVDQVDAMAEPRNNAIHAPCCSATGAEGTVMIASFFTGHPRAKNLQGVNLLEEFEWLERRTEALSYYTMHLETVLGFPQYPRRDRPILPERCEPKRPLY